MAMLNKVQIDKYLEKAIGLSCLLNVVPGVAHRLKPSVRNPLSTPTLHEICTKPAKI